MHGGRRRDLEAVVGKFAQWRRNRRRRPIPEDLWAAAIGLLDTHGVSEVCRALGVNHSRFNEVRARRSKEADRRAARCDVAARSRRPEGVARRSAPAHIAGEANGFVELLPLRLGPGGAVMSGNGTHRMGVPAAAADGWRLTLESATGTISLVTRGSGAATGGDLVETLSRLVIASVVGGLRR